MLLVIKEEVPSELSPGLDQEDTERPHIKENQEQLRTNQEGEQLQGLEEADNTKFLIILVPVKSEDEEEPLDCGGSEAARNLDSQPDTDSSETDDSDVDWQEPLSVSEHETEDSDRTPESSLDTLKSDQVHIRDTRCNPGKKFFSCSECGARFRHKHNLQRHMRIHTGEKPFGCDVCGKTFTTQGNVKTHMRVHTGEKPFGCEFCGKRFTTQGNVETHMRIHTGEKPFGCDVCGKGYTRQMTLKAHMRVHT